MMMFWRSSRLRGVIHGWIETTSGRSASCLTTASLGSVTRTLSIAQHGVLLDDRLELELVDERERRLVLVGILDHLDGELLVAEWRRR